MVTIDKAEAMGVINIASPIVNPKFTIATAPASILPIDTTIIFVFVVAFVRAICNHCARCKLHQSLFVKKLHNPGSFSGGHGTTDTDGHCTGFQNFVNACAEFQGLIRLKQNTGSAAMG